MSTRSKFLPIILATVMLCALPTPAHAAPTGSVPAGQDAAQVLSTLPVRDQGHAGSDRKKHDWNQVDGRQGSFNTRDLVLERDMGNVEYKSNGRVKSGTLKDPYTNTVISFESGSGAQHDGGIQIDHVVAYAEAYNSGLDQYDEATRDRYYNDPDVLLAVQNKANTTKSDKDAAHWQPDNTGFACQYASLQIGIKAKWGLSVDATERQALSSTLAACPGQQIIATNQVRGIMDGLDQQPQPDDSKLPTVTSPDANTGNGVLDGLGSLIGGGKDDEGSGQDHDAKADGGMWTSTTTGIIAVVVLVAGLLIGGGRGGRRRR